MVFDFLRKAPLASGDAAVPERKASAASRVVAWGSGGRVAWSPRDAVSLARTGYLGNPIGFRAVRLIAEAASALPLICQDNERRYETHPLLDLIHRLAHQRPAAGRTRIARSGTFNLCPHPFRTGPGLASPTAPHDHPGLPVPPWRQLMGQRPELEDPGQRQQRVLVQQAQELSHVLLGRGGKPACARFQLGRR